VDNNCPEQPNKRKRKKSKSKLNFGGKNDKQAYIFLHLHKITKVHSITKFLPLIP
jgi:hypothetical protein